jgi:transcriptional regulator with XRE-family HTH domain
MNMKTPLDPKLLGFWVRCIRDSQHMSQEALAVTANVTVRTIQRFESGQPVSITSRRCIARALKYENADTFDDPAFAVSVHQLLDQIRSHNESEQAKQHPDHVRVKVAKVLNGEALGLFAEASNAVLLHADDDLSEEIKDDAAALFDYVRDLMDLDEVPFSNKRAYHRELEAMLRGLEEQGTLVYSAFRNVKLTNDSWSDKTPLPMTVGYLTVVPASKQLDEMYVPRRASFG